MAKRSKRPRLSEYASAAADKPSRASRKRDPVTTFARFSNFMSLGLVAAALYMPFPDSLNFVPSDKTKLDHPLITLDYFPDALQKVAVAVVHYRTAWVAMAVVSTIITLLWYRTRYRPRRAALVRWGPLIGLSLIGLHAGALGYLQRVNGGMLHVQYRSTADHALPLEIPADQLFPATGPATSAATSTAPALAPVPTYRFGGTIIGSSTFYEGKSTQWQRLFAADTLFIAPILFAWLMSFGMKFLPPSPADTKNAAPR